IQVWRGDVKAPKFSYVRADSVEQAIQLLALHGDEARILAGGQSLMPTLNMRLSQPRLLIDINRLDVLAGISLYGNRVRIGALTRHAVVASSRMVVEHLPLIAEAMPHVGHVRCATAGRSAAASHWLIRRRRCRLASLRSMRPSSSKVLPDDVRCGRTTIFMASTRPHSGPTSCWSKF